MINYVIENFKNDINNCVTREEILQVFDHYQLEEEVEYDLDQNGNVSVSKTGFNAQDIFNSCDDFEVKVANVMNDINCIVEINNPKRLEIYSLYTLQNQVKNHISYDESLKNTIKIINQHQQELVTNLDIINDLGLNR